MAGDLEFSVGVDTKGAVQSLKSLENTLGSVSGAFKLLLGGITLGTIAKFSDEITNLKNSLTQFATSQANVNDQFTALAAIAITSRTSLSAVGDLYSKIVRSADQLGISQKEAAQITETVSKALVVSGQSASSAQGALLQLGQALASGSLQGDELRSILEGMPAIARILADSLGVPVAALKQMGAAGQISGEQVVNALLKAKDVIDNQFAKTVPTISQAFEELKTSTALAFNNFENSTQTGQNFAISIEYLGFMVYKLSKNIDAIIGPLGTFLQIIGSLLAITLVGRAFAVVEGIFMGIVGAGRLLASSWGQVVLAWEILTTSITTGVSGFVYFFQVIEKGLPLLGYITKAIVTVGSAIGAFLGIGKLVDWFKSLGDSNSTARTELADYRTELEKMKTSAGGLSDIKPPPMPGVADPKFLQQLDQQVIGYKRGNAELERRIRFQMDSIGLSDQDKTVKQAQFDLETTYLGEINKLMDEYRVKSQSKNKNDLAALPEITKRIQQLAEAYGNELGVITKLSDQAYILAELEKRRLNLAEFGIKTQIDGQKKLRDLQDNIAKSTMTEIEQKYYDINRAAEDSARTAIDTENTRRRSLKLTQMSAAEEAAYYSTAKSGLAELKRGIDADYENSRKWSTGWKSAFNSYVSDATNAANIAKNLFNKTMSGMEDLIVNFVKTGKFEWKSFVASMAEELLRANIKQMLGSIFSPDTAMGGGLSSILGALSGTAGKKGDTANNPMFVYDIAGGSGAGGSAFGGAAGQGQGGGIFGTISNVFGGIKSAVGNVFGGISDAVGSVFSGVSNAVSGISNIFSGGGGGGGSDLFSGISDFFSGWFADGGTIPGGKFGVVGERGPELVSGPATVTPMGGGTNVTYNINAVDAQSFKAMIAADPGFIHAVASMGSKTVTGRR